MSARWAGGSTRRWRAIRRTVLERDLFLCRAHTDGWCARAGAAEHVCRVRVALEGDNAGHAHHTRGKAHGDALDDIVTACAPCNLAIGEPAEPDARPQPRTRWKR